MPLSLSSLCRVDSLFNQLITPRHGTETERTLPLRYAEIAKVDMKGMEGRREARVKPEMMTRMDAERERERSLPHIICFGNESLRHIPVALCMLPYRVT